MVIFTWNSQEMLNALKRKKLEIRHYGVYRRIPGDKPGPVF